MCTSCNDTSASSEATPRAPVKGTGLPKNDSIPQRIQSRDDETLGAPIRLRQTQTNSTRQSPPSLISYEDAPNRRSDRWNTESLVQHQFDNCECSARLEALCSSAPPTVTVRRHGTRDGGTAWAKGDDIREAHLGVQRWEMPHTASATHGI